MKERKNIKSGESIAVRGQIYNLVGNLNTIYIIISTKEHFSRGQG